ncbi:hypothetical protein ACFQ0X_43625 [Streptomyces rectiviolaceus]|uniref:Uncharacterized protein n=1 Tax=Streptomyces rectiviolaceus TaxID=332591 RepID=A0ABP6NMW2_9ACTN
MSAPSEPQAHGVRIDAQPGSATITLDGQALPAGTVTGYTIQHNVHEALPTLLLHTCQPEGVLWQGFARVAVAIDQSPGDLIAEFLAAVDPVLLDQEALNRSDYGGGPGATAVAMLATLTEWARGQRAGT